PMLELGQRGAGARQGAEQEQDDAPPGRERSLAVGVEDDRGCLPAGYGGSDEIVHHLEGDVDGDEGERDGEEEAHSPAWRDGESDRCCGLVRPVAVRWLDLIHRVGNPLRAPPRHEGEFYIWAGPSLLE